MNFIPIILLLCVLPCCSPREDCCAERNDLAETLRMQSTQLDAAERDAYHVRALLEELQSSILDEKTKNKPTNTTSP